MRVVVAVVVVGIVVGLWSDAGDVNVFHGSLPFPTWKTLTRV